MEQKKKPVIVSRISKDIQFKGMKHVDLRTEAEKHIKKEPYYMLVNKATGKPVMEFVKS